MRRAWVVLLASSLAWAAEVSGSIEVKGDQGRYTFYLNAVLTTASGDPEFPNGVGGQGKDAPVGLTTQWKADKTGARFSLSREQNGFRYAIADLPRGWLLVYAMLVSPDFGKDDGREHREDPKAWKWIEVRKEDDRLTADFTLDVSPDPKSRGSLSIKGSDGKAPKVVRFVPIDGVDPSCPLLKRWDVLPLYLYTELLPWRVESAGVENLLPGKYLVEGGGRPFGAPPDPRKGELAKETAEVEVKAGEKTEVTLSPEKR